jgi:predicted dehydrogenase
MIRSPRAVGILVVGVGSMGAQRAAAAVRARGCRLAGVTDQDRHRASAVAQRHGADCFHDLEAGLDSPDVDLVVVATPHSDHPHTVRLALERGKHVLCEKPLAIEPGDARELALLADVQGLRLATGFNHRFYPPVRDALRLVSEWAIGRIESLRIQIGHKASAAFLDGWHCVPEVSGGGTWIDNGPHACDLVRRFMGVVTAGQGYLRHTLGGRESCESEAFALFRNHDRAVAEVRSSWVLEAGYLTIEVRGSDGHLRIDTAPWRITGTLADGRVVNRRYVADRLRERWFRARHGCELSLVRELEALVGGQPAAATGWDGFRAAEMVAAVYSSAGLGREVACADLAATVA